jgi:hypothetical protein
VTGLWPHVRLSPHLVATMLPAAFGSTDPRRRNGRQILAARQTRAVTPEFQKVCVPEETFLSWGNMGRYVGT